MAEMVLGQRIFLTALGGSSGASAGEDRACDRGFAPIGDGRLDLDAFRAGRCR